MELWLVIGCYLFAALTADGRLHGFGDNRDSLLYRTLDALDRALEHMHEEIDYLNLDAVANTRQVEAQLDAFLTFEPEVFLVVGQWVEELRDRAKSIADAGIGIITKNYPIYAKELGFLLGELKKHIWYRSSFTSGEFVEDPVPCGKTAWNGTASDLCFSELAGRGGPKDNPCNVSESCIEMKTERHQRDYGLSHQLLHFILMEELQCIESVPEALRLRFCSNVLRDAMMIAEADFPLSHRDLFLEQVGLCGFWGFREFNNPEWLERILEWQDPCGCYKNVGYYVCMDTVPGGRRRAKRSEKTLPDGCLAHKTSLAMMALAVNIRFEAEKEFLEMERIVLSNLLGE